MAAVELQCGIQVSFTGLLSGGLQGGQSSETKVRVQDDVKQKRLWKEKSEVDGAINIEKEATLLHKAT